MAKGSRRRIFRLGKNNEGCLWGLFSMFDFHHGRNSPRLLSNREHGSGRIVVADGYLSDEQDLQTDFAEKDSDSGLPGQDDVQNEVFCGEARIIVDETSNSHQAGCSSFINEKQMLRISQCEDPSRNSISRNDFPRAVSHQVDHDFTALTHHNSPCPLQSLRDRSGEGLELTTLSQGIEDERKKDHGIQYRKKSHLNASILTQSKPKQPNARAILSRRFLRDFCDKLFRMEQMAPQEALHHFEELINALELLSSNKELLSELLQEPDSKLMEYVQKLQDIHGADVPITIEDKPLQEQNAANILATGRGLEVQRTKGTLKRIVVLKPIPSRMEGLSIASSSISSHISSSNTTAYMGKRGTMFHFPFQEIKRRLRHAIGERKTKRKVIRTDIQENSHGFRLGYRKITNGVHPHWPAINSCNNGKDHGVESQRKEKPKRHHGDIDLAVDSNRGQDKRPICVLERESNFQREAKKHLIEILHSKHEHLPEKRDSKALYSVLSLQEYNFSHGYNGDRCNNSSSSPPWMRFSPFWTPNLQENPERVSLVRHKPENMDSCSVNADVEACMLDFSSKFTNTKLGDEDHTAKVASHKGTVKVVDDDNNCKIDLFETTLSVDEISDNNSHEVAELDVILTADETQSPILDSAMDTKSSTPPTSPGILLIRSTEAHEVIMEKLERPSPVSVLTPPFVDDATSSNSPVSEQREDVGLPVSPRELFLDEYDKPEVLITSRFERVQQELMGEEEFRLEYIGSVLEASGLIHAETWDTKKSLHGLLDSSLFDEVGIPFKVIPCDLMLLFDCISEVVEGIHEKYFPRNVWAAFVKPNVRPFPCRESLIKEVYEKTACQHATHSWNNLNQIIQRDLDMIVWMDTSTEIDEMGIAIEDDILEEVLEDLVFDIFD